AAFFTVRRRDDHSLRFQAPQFARLEVRDDHDFTTDQFLRLVVLRDAGEYLPWLLFPNIDFHQQKLIGFRDTLSGKNLAHAQIDFRKVIDLDEARHTDSVS